MALIINGETVDDDVIDQEFSAIKASYEQMAPISCCERNDEFRGYAKDKITAQVLLNQESRRRNEAVSAQEIDEALAQMIEEHGGKDGFYAAYGITQEQDDQVRATLEDNLRLQKFIDGVCPDHELTGEAIERYYDEHIDGYMSIERVRALHVHKTPTRGEEREQDFKAMCEARRRLLDGEDFYTIAEEYSTPPEEGAEPGDGEKETDRVDLGFFSRGELMDEFEIVAFSMALNEVSPVFWTQFGFHILKLVDRDPAEPAPLEEIRDQVAEDLQHSLRNRDLEAYVEELKARATIEDDDVCSEEGCQH
ncbi:MAG: peptidylprolyl isomerase [Planctomycetota bacterium]|jgi:parvulin-like peptidyl-prolyl isomerase